MKVIRFIKYLYHFLLRSGMLVAGLAFCALLIINACDTSMRVEPKQGEVFIKLFGGNGSEEGKDLLQLPDGGFVLVGSTTSAIIPSGSNASDSIPSGSNASDSIGGKDIYVVLTDENGNPKWERRYGGPGDDVASSVILSGDGLSIYVCGEKTQEGSDLRNVWVANIAFDGTLISNPPQEYGNDSWDEIGKDILDIKDGGFLITGTWLTGDTSRFYMVETDDNLAPVDNRQDYVWGTSNVENLSTTSFETTENNATITEFVCFGSVLEFHKKTMQFQSFIFQGGNDKGINQERYGSDDYHEICTDACPTMDGGFVLAGYQQFRETKIEMVVKIDAKRNEMWRKEYPNAFNRSIGESCGIIQTQDGGYLVSSKIQLDDTEGNDEISLLKLDFGGNFEWRQTFGSSDNDTGAKVIQLEDGSYAIIGTMGFDLNSNSERKLCLIKVTANGELIPAN